MFLVRERARGEEKGRPSYVHSHAGIAITVAILTGANVYSCVTETCSHTASRSIHPARPALHLARITIDPDKGPISSMTAGQPFAILSAGYIGSILVGSAMIMTAFDISASKVTSLTLFPLLIVCFWFGRTWARIQVLGCIGLTIGFWFS